MFNNSSLPTSTPLKPSSVGAPFTLVSSILNQRAWRENATVLVRFMISRVRKPIGRLRTTPTVALERSLQ